MAKYHQVQDKMYDDLEFLSWSSQVKHLWTVLITNPRAELCGVQENNLESLQRLTSLPKEEIQAALAFLVEAGKIVISQTTQEIAIRNYIRHNVTASPKQKTAVARQLAAVKDKTLLHYLDGARDYLPSLKQIPKPQQPQLQSKRKLPDEYSTFDRLKLQQIASAARSELRSELFTQHTSA